MTSHFDLVSQFHKRFHLPRFKAFQPYKPNDLTHEDFMFRFKFLEEELEELADAHDMRDEDERIEHMADALVDLVYVALGTAHMMHIPFDALFEEVHRVNMLKERTASVEESAKSTGRGHTYDVVKPKGWKPPNLRSILWPSLR